MSKEKIINTNLRDLIEKSWSTDVIPTIEQNYAKESIKYIDVDLIDDSQFIKSARISEHNVTEIEDNIKVNGLKRPLLVRPIKNRYEIVIGRRIFVACRLLKMEQIPVVVQNYNDEETLLILLADTLEQRSSNIIEVAYIMKNLSTKFNYKNVDLARLIKKSKAQVSNILKLLSLPKEILRDIVNSKLSYGHAKAISRLSPEDALVARKEIYANGFTVRETEAYVQNLIKKVEICRVFTRKKGIYIKLDDEKKVKKILPEIKKLVKDLESD